MIGCLVLAYNEENYIEEILTEISDTFDKIIVVNDGSTDKTANKIKNLDLNNISLISNDKNFGAGRSLEIGVKNFLDSELDYLVKIDGDKQFKIEDINKLVQLSNKDYDFIKCDRFWEKGIEGKIPTIRYIGNALATLLIKISTGNWKINDPLNGLFLFSRKSLKDFSLPKIFRRYGYPFYINIFMNKKILFDGLINGQIQNTIRYSDEKSRLRPSIMFFKLLYYSIVSFGKKIFVKLRYSDLQISALHDILFIIFSFFTIYGGIKLFLINLDYLKGSKASWLFLTLLMLFISSFSFYNSQAYEKKVYDDKFTLL